MDKQKDRLKDRRVYKWTDRVSDLQTDEETERWIDRQGVRPTNG